MGGARVDPPTCKTETFFLMSLTLTEPSQCVFLNPEKSRIRIKTGQFLSHHIGLALRAGRTQPMLVLCVQGRRG